MRRFILYFGILASICASCAPNCRDTTLYHSDGRQKAIVAVLPVINHAIDADLSWDLSRELTDEIRKRVYDSTKIYLLRDHGSREVAEKLNTPNPAAIPLEEAKNLGAAEFVVVTELIEQKESPYGLRLASEDHPLKGEIGSVLNVSMRVRVIDVRTCEPKVILQEVMKNKHVIARAYMSNDYSKTPWGTEAFQRTPLGLAHSKIVRELISRVENYIEAAR